MEADRFVTVEDSILDQYLVNRPKLLICGEGLEKWEIFRQKEGVSLLPVSCNAPFLAEIAWEQFRAGEFAELASAVPNYLKPPNITVPA
jgi:hypothetical protein